MATSRRLQVQRWPPTPVPTSSSELNRERTAKIARLEQNERNRDGRFTRGFSALATRTSQGQVPRRRGVQREGRGSGEIRREELPPSALRDGLSP